MEVSDDRLVGGSLDSPESPDSPGSLGPSKNHFIQTSCNWRVTNNKDLREAIVTEPSSQKPKAINLDDVVSLETCISLQPNQYETESCVLDLKLTNGQKISHLAIASEFRVMELFKEYGEYDKTIVSKFEDELEDTRVYFGEASIVPPSTEASIKFVRKPTSSEVWIYGIKLYLTEPAKNAEDNQEEIFNPFKYFLTTLSFKNERIAERNGCVNNILNGAERVQSLEQSTEEKNENVVENCKNKSTIPSVPDMRQYIDNKFHEMETRLTKRIEEMEHRTNQKLDAILKHLESQSSAK